MERTKFDDKFFESTRGRVVALLRGASRTVGEIAASLGITDNAVRAHLLSLERDGIVRQSGIRPGARKPHFAYELTPESERLFPKAYDAVLNALIAVLKAKTSRVAVERTLREVGRSLAGEHAAGERGERLDRRIERAVSVLESLGGAAVASRDGDAVSIASASCPLASAVAEHPEACKVAEALVAEIAGVPVLEHCDRSGAAPRCRFEIADTSA